MIWIPKIDIGLRKIASIAVIFLVLHLSVTRYIPQAHFFFAGAEASVLVLLLLFVFKFGIMRRIYTFHEHHEIYHVVDYYNFLRPLKNFRALTDSRQNGFHSKIYLRAQKPWAFFESYRSILFHSDAPPNCRVLILGGGGGSLGKQILDIWGNAEIDMVEISEQIIEVAKKYFLNQTNMRHVHLHRQDAIKYVSLSNNKYDVIIIDLFINTIIENRSTSKKFLKDIKRLSKIDTTILINFNSESHLELTKIISTYKKIFPNFALYRLYGLLIGYSGKPLIDI